MTGPRGQAPDPGRRNGWLVAMVAVPVLCCAAPGLLALAGVGSVGALFAFGAGQVAIGVAVIVLLCGLGAVLVARRRRRTAPGP